MFYTLFSKLSSEYLLEFDDFANKYLTIIHNLFVCPSVACMHLWTLTPPKSLGGSLQNFQGLIRAPHCISS